MTAAEEALSAAPGDASPRVDLLIDRHGTVTVLLPAWHAGTGPATGDDPRAWAEDLHPGEAISVSRDELGRVVAVQGRADGASLIVGFGPSEDGVRELAIAAIAYSQALRRELAMERACIEMERRATAPVLTVSPGRPAGSCRRPCRRRHRP